MTVVPPSSFTGSTTPQVLFSADPIDKPVFFLDKASPNRGILVVNGKQFSVIVNHVNKQLTNDVLKDIAWQTYQFFKNEKVIGTSFKTATLAAVGYQVDNHSKLLSTAQANQTNQTIFQPISRAPHIPLQQGPLSQSLSSPLTRLADADDENDKQQLNGAQSAILGAAGSVIGTTLGPVGGKILSTIGGGALSNVMGAPVMDAVVSTAMGGSTEPSKIAGRMAGNAVGGFVAPLFGVPAFVGSLGGAFVGDALSGVSGETYSKAYNLGKSAVSTVYNFGKRMLGKGEKQPVPANEPDPVNPPASPRLKPKRKTKTE